MKQRLVIILIFIGLSIISLTISLPYIRQSKEGLIFRIKRIDKNYFGTLSRSKIMNKFTKEELQEILNKLKEINK